MIFLPFILITTAAIAQPGEPIGQPLQPPTATAPGQPQKIMIKGVEYKKLATREETQARMLDLLAPARVKWGDWQVIGAWEFKRQGELAKPRPVEDELRKMSPGGPGPDLAAVYKGKGDVDCKWQSIGQKIDTQIDFTDYLPTKLHDWTVSYLYTTATVSQSTTIDVTMGSDDGLRFWLNGKLLVDADEMRSLDAEEHKLKLDLKPGVNHLLAKVSNGNVAYSYQLNQGGVIDETTAQLLDYHLSVDFPASDEDRYYRSLPLMLPPDIVLEVGGLDMLPDGRPIVSTRRGDIYIIDGAYDEPPTKCRFTRFAAGLHEPLGLQVRMETQNGKPVPAVYCVQRAELTRMVDLTGDGVADLYQTFSDGWGVSGNYHEFAFGPKFDSHGNAWVTLNVGFCDSLGKSIVPWRGWSLKVGTDGSIEPVSGGLRSPNGIGFWHDGQAFYMDNQGDYVGTNRLAPLMKDGWNGHPSGLHWRKDYTPEMDRPGGYPPLVPATVWFPYKKMGQSVADFLLLPNDDASAAGAGDRTKGPLPGGGGQYSYGPFAGQAFTGDQTLCTVMRVSIEKIDGVYQGACYPFRGGLQCGANRLAFGKDGSLFVGQTDRGWGSIGRRRYGLERLVWSGQIPFEIREIKIARDGFVIDFTKDIDTKAAGDAASYACTSYTYEYHARYGSDEMETARPQIASVEVLGPRQVRLRLDQVRSGGMGYVHELSFPGVKGRDGESLLHPIAYYTVQRLPAK